MPVWGPWMFCRAALSFSRWWCLGYILILLRTLVSTKTCTPSSSFQKRYYTIDSWNRAVISWFLWKRWLTTVNNKYNLDLLRGHATLLIYCLINASLHGQLLGQCGLIFSYIGNSWERVVGYGGICRMGARKFCHTLPRLATVCQTSRALTAQVHPP